jgi:hypothetical protein
MAVSAYTEITDVRLEEIKPATEVDCDLQELISIIQSGWPEKRSEVPLQHLQHAVF